MKGKRLKRRLTRKILRSILREEEVSLKESNRRFTPFTRYKEEYDHQQFNQNND